MHCEREKNKAAAYAMLKDRKRHLNETDRRSLTRAIGGLSDFGSDFSNFRTKVLADVPNTVITGFCQILKDADVPVYLPREADRYNEISTLCIQETWNSHLKDFFQVTSFINLCHTAAPVVQKEPMKSSELYLNALSALDQEMPEASVAALIQAHDSANITHVALMKHPYISIVSAFSKRGSAHKLLAYGLRKGDVVTTFDIREKKQDKKKQAAPNKKEIHEFAFDQKVPIYFPQPQPAFLMNSASSSPAPLPLQIYQNPSVTITNDPSQFTEPFTVPTKKNVFPSLADMVPIDPLHAFNPKLSFLAQFS